MRTTQAWASAVVGLVGAASLLVGCSAERPVSQTPPSHQPRDTTSSQSPPGDTALERQLTLPSGFKIEYFAHVSGARWLALGPDQSVYVALPQAGQIARLYGFNHAGLPDSQAIVAQGLNRPHGMRFHGGYFYVANLDGVVRFSLDARGVPTGGATYVNHYASDGLHVTRTIVFGADSAMYVSVGSSCNVCVESDSTHATVMRFDESGANGRVFARGLRNAVGLAVNPVTHAVWATQNERDDLPPNHQDAPPDELNILTSGGDYGWPYCWGDRVPNPEFNNASRCAPTIPPALGFQAHSAVLGITFLDRATALPASMRGDALAAFHGSWDRNVPTGDKIVRIHIANGLPTSYDDFITGWQQSDGSRWGRVADIMVAGDGTLLITDDAVGAVYRVRQ